MPGTVLVAEDRAVKKPASSSKMLLGGETNYLCVFIFFFFYCGTISYWRLRLKINKYTPMCDFIVLYVDQKHRAAPLGSLRISQGLGCSPESPGEGSPHSGCWQNPVLWSLF